MPQIRTWALIADGARAFIVENSGPDNGWVELPHHRYASQHSESHGPSGSHDTIHHDGKMKFAHELAGVLATEFKAHAFQALLIAAPPAMLGDLRKSLSHEVGAVVKGEVSHDLTKTPIHELTKHLHLI